MNSSWRRERWAWLVRSSRLWRWLVPSVLGLLEVREKKVRRKGRAVAGGGRAGAGSPRRDGTRTSAPCGCPCDGGRGAGRASACGRGTGGERGGGAVVPRRAEGIRRRSCPRTTSGSCPCWSRLRAGRECGASSWPRPWAFQWSRRRSRVCGRRRNAWWNKVGAPDAAGGVHPARDAGRLKAAGRRPARRLLMSMVMDHSTMASCMAGRVS